jgi:hypothetical protein
MKKWLMPVVFLFAATSAMAATWTWSSAVNLADWTNSSSWAEASVPANDGTADIVITNVTLADYTSEIYENWSINSLTFNGTAGGQFTYIGPAATAQALTIGSGGISGTRMSSGSERWFVLHPNITFSAASVSIRTNSGASWFSVQLMKTIDSSAVGGSTVKILTGYNGGYLRFDTGSFSTTNMNWILENSRIANYNENPTTALGSNTLKVAWSEGARNANRSTTIGMYGAQNIWTVKNAAYFDTPIEVDPFSVGSDSGVNLRPLTLISQRLRNDGGLLTNYFRGLWTSKNGVAVTNAQGDGWLQISGSSDGAGVNFGQVVSMYQQDASGLLVNSVANPSWNGDVAINDGYHVVAAAHAFGTNNSWAVNLKSSSGTATVVRARQFFLADGIEYTGVIRSYGQNHTTNVAGDISRGQGWLGIHGTGTGTYSGNIWLFGATPAGSIQKVYDLYLYATNGSLALFRGNFVTNLWGGENPNVYVTGGGTVVAEGILNYAGKTTIQSNTTFKFDGLNNSSEIEVLAGSTLKGEGSTSPNVIMGGDFAPGGSIGTFYAGGDVDFLTGSTLTIELGPGNTEDLLAVTGDLDISLATLRLVGSDIGTFTIASYGTLTGSSFLNIDTTGLTGGVTFDSIDYTTDSQISLTVIPEPASILLMASGLVAAFKLRRRA